MSDKYLDKAGLGRVWNRAKGTFVDKEYFDTLAVDVLGVSVRGTYGGDNPTVLLGDNTILDTLNRVWIDGTRRHLTSHTYSFDGGVHDVWFKFEGAAVPAGAFLESDIIDAVVGGFITTIDDIAFCHTVNMRVVVLPNSVTSIGANAFDRCGAVEFHCLAATPPTLGTDVFGSGLNATLYVPIGSYNAYRAAGWADWFLDIVEV